MTHTRDEMQTALKQTVVPYLRSVGFKGSLPHFHRLRGSRIDLLTVQYYSAGSCLLIEIASAANDGKMKPADQRADRLGKRLRLYRGDNRNNHWFCYTPHGLFSTMQAPDEIAQQFSELLATQAETWWAMERGAGN